MNWRWRTRRDHAARPRRGGRSPLDRSWNIRAVAWVTATWIGVAAMAAGACPLLLPVVTAQVNRQALVLEVAESFEERQCGLSGRRALAPDRGMLFVLPRRMPVAFWMRDTPLALDIAFLDEQRRIVDIQAMDPERPDTLYRSPGPVRYVIEVNRSWFARHKVGVGDQVAIPTPAAIAPRARP